MTTQIYTDGDLYLEGHFIDGCSLWLIIDLHPIDFHHQTSNSVRDPVGGGDT